MREPLQNGAPHGYERPNQPWVCGLASDGHACPAGPTAAGGCPALAECMPVRDGDRWKCNRSTLRGGPCDDGPSHEGGCAHVNCCRPVRSLRTIRGRFVTACALATAGAVLMLLSADWRDEFISPGPLAGQHAQLLARDGGTMQCSACHAAAEDGLGGWTAALVVGYGEAPTQSELCMKCHAQTISPELALAAHNVPPQELAEITANNGGAASRGALSAVVNAVFNSPPDKLACATCHQEHHGAAHDLTAMDNASCQACHQRRYESFAGDHPDFGVWPYERRTRIVFNHASHQSKHFAEKNQTFDCRSCHVEDETRTAQLTAGFAQACASCHDGPIATSVARGVPMFALPTLDVDALRNAGVELRGWPDAATGDFDGRLPLPMMLLLAADPAAASAIDTLGADFDFLEVDPDDPEQVRAAGALAVAIQKLFAELSQTGPAAVRERLKTAIGREISAAQLDALVAGLSVDTLRPAVATWLPDVDAGSGNWAPVADVASDAKPLAFDPAGNWSRDEATLTIRYRPTGHADPVLAEWLALVVETPGVEGQPLEATLLKEMTKPTAPGLCASCHSVERTGENQLAVNWQAYDRTIEKRTFTKFSHGPHLLLPQLADCAACHAIDTTAATATAYTDTNPHAFASEFAPMSKQECAACHTPRAAGDRCQSCHRYHVDEALNRGP